jgi:SAM-dependent methyltransferase
VATEREIQELKDQSRSSWGTTPYAALSERLRPASVELVRACGLEPGVRVLDVAAGDGNAAVEAARAGARVVASDLAPAMVEQGRARTAEEGVDVEWVEADVEELPFEDGSFDCVVSVFGAQLTPRPDRVAAELFRVVRPGGTVGMANWGPGGFQEGFFQILRRYRPPEPEDIPPSTLWGDEQALRSRFDGLADSVSLEPRILPWRFASLAEMLEFFRSNAPRQAQLAQTLPEERRQALVGEMVELVNRHNSADDGSVRIDAEYFVVVARKRG